MRFRLSFITLGVLMAGCGTTLDQKIDTWNRQVAEATTVKGASASSGTDAPLPAVRFTAHLGGVRYMDTARIVHVATTLHNPTSDTVRFISMSCSYEDMFVVGGNGSYIVRPRYDCYKNAPIVASIPPGSSMDQFIMIAAVDRNTRVHSGRLRIGMMWLDPSEHQDIISAYKERNKLARVIWSDELDLDRLYRRSYGQ